ncbi:M28 family metallopeptidase [Haloimpatiens lingqiaonensis]|uniref:M28 family metallopeptidase n=1 Tax=Haloimpatiens lingqiaonensis TaxID=1380675 RepID=UPI0010FE8FE7|nr:M28 family metallopeptidase [Haloimpatiens lingqiaonensis]
MKKSKNLIGILLLFIFIISFSFSFRTYICLNKFDTSKVIKHIEYLSSDKFQGRLPGTMENRMAEQYIKSQFKNYNLKPLDKNYLQSFKIKYPSRISNKTPYLNVVDKNNNIIKKFTYGKDFKEDMLNFKHNCISFTKSNSYFTSGGIKADSKDSSVIFYCTSKKLDFRSSFMVDAPNSMYIMITKDTLSDIYDYIKKDYTVNCYIPYETKETYSNNVTAKIEGTNKNLPPMVLSAHFDHVGTDLGGNIYNGALDNASGVAFIMEMSKIIQSLGKPKRDIIIVGFNGEEFGFVGSTAFAEKYSSKLQGGKVFNFDMIGGNTTVPLCLMGSKKDSKDNEFLKSIATTCSNEKINFSSMFEDASDHKPFRDRNIDAVTFCDNDTSKIHTPNDKVEFINNASITRCFNVTSKEIMKYSFNNNPFVIHYKICMILSSTGIIVLACYFIYGVRKHSYKKQ